MTHLDDGRLRALMDDELSDSTTRTAQLHLDECDPCSSRLAELEGSSARVVQALARLDTATPPGRARSAVLEKIGSGPRDIRKSAIQDLASEQHTELRRRSRSLTPLARAAMLVLFLGGGAVTALPASPVRGWIGAGWARAVDLFDPADVAPTPFGPGGESAVPAPGAVGGAQDVAPAGIRLSVTGDGVSIVLRETGPGTSIVVRLVAGREAGAFADDPATFRTAEGRIEVIGASGIVFMNLPMETTTASIEVNGGIYLRKVGQQIDVIGPIETRTTTEIRMQVP